MRLVVFDDFRLGVVTSDDRLADITHLVADIVDPADRMTALITRWSSVAGTVADVAAGGGGVPVAEARLRAPQPRPSKIVAAPVNYRRHLEEMGGDGGVYPGRTIESIETRAGFIVAPSSIVGPDQAIVLPSEDRRVDHEAELGVVIGCTAKHVSRDRALDAVFAYVPLLDITLRGDEDRSFRKSFDTFTPLGPMLVTADEAGDPESLDFELRVNGHLRQRANTRDLIYSVARLIELYSQAMTLYPGDIIATGTPEGVGPIIAGDEISLSIESIGALRMSVRGPSA